MEATAEPPKGIYVTATDHVHRMLLKLYERGAIAFYADRDKRMADRWHVLITRPDTLEEARDLLHREAGIELASNSVAHE